MQLKAKNILSKKKMVMLITGADGFVGSNACRYYQKRGWAVHGFSEKSSVIDGIKITAVNLLDYDGLRKKIYKIQPDVVLHLGALVVLDRSFEVAKRCIDVNIHGTLNLLEAVKDLPLERFVFFSTEEVYGKNTLPYKENQLLLPPSPYSVSKIAGENLCLLYKEWYALPVVIFRMATVFGPYQPITRFIPTLITKALKNEEVPLNSGKNKRDYLFVEELIEATEKALSAEKAIGQIFNIGGTKSFSGKELAEKIITLSKSTSKILLNAFPDRSGEARLWKMNNAKARRLLGWKPRASIDEDLQKTINFYRRNI